VVHGAPLERQGRIEGAGERVSDEASDAYFRTRPLGSRHSALASPQSTVVADRAWLEREFEAVVRRYPADPPRPPHWGGYRVAPDRIEFWQGRPDRMHDRLQYRRRGDDWVMERLAP
jgi:pyridoxamine 5'-phosphate oxidase